MKSMRNAIVLLLTVVLLASCSSSFVYNRLDWPIPWWVNGYVDLTRDQKNRILQAAQDMQRFDSVWLEERRQWLDQLESLLARQAGWQQHVIQAYARRESTRTPQYARIVEHNTNVISQAIADVLNSRSLKQSDHAAREFDELRETLEKLMQDSAA